jgi:hypothetical protein
MKDIKPVIPQEEQEGLFDSLNSRHKKLAATILSIAMGGNVFGESRDKYCAPDNSVEICQEEFDLVSRVDSNWAKSFAEKNSDKDFKYLGVLKVKSGNYHVFQNGKKMVSINPVAKLHGLTLRYYLVVKFVKYSLRNKIVMETF